MTHSYISYFLDMLTYAVMCHVIILKPGPASCQRCCPCIGVFAQGLTNILHKLTMRQRLPACS